MAEHDRDESVDRLLRRTLRGAPIPPLPGVCVDGETLAAWTAGTLRSHKASTVEQHVADCDRCQAMLATFVRTTPSAPPAEPLWHRWRLQWLVPLATAATALALWVALPSNRQGVARPEPEAQTASRLDAPGLAPEPSSQQAKAPAGPALANDTADRAERQVPQSAAPPVPTESIGKLAQAENENRVADEAPARSDAGQSARSSEFAPASPTARADDSPRANSREKLAEADAKNEPSAPARPLAASSQARALADVRPTGVIEIAVPGSAVRWRVTGENQVERSTSDVAWIVVALPAPAVLTAGSAPSPLVCWIVGRGGSVFVTTDGTRFTRVPFAEAVDLVSVSATDERRATVTAADGRTWRTTDQGRTWAR